MQQETKKPWRAQKVRFRLGDKATAVKTKQQVSLSWLDQMNTDSNLMYSIIFSREEKLRGLSLWIPLLLCLSTAVHTPPSTAQPHKRRLNLQTAPVKEPVERQLPFTLISFVLAKLFLIQISSVIRYYHKVLPTVVQPQPKKWQTAINSCSIFSQLCLVLKATTHSTAQAVILNGSSFLQFKRHSYISGVVNKT